MFRMSSTGLTCWTAWPWTPNCVPINAVIHFAGLKAVGESVSEPLRITTTMSPR